MRRTTNGSPGMVGLQAGEYQSGKPLQERYRLAQERCCCHYPNQQCSVEVSKVRILEVLWTYSPSWHLFNHKRVYRVYCKMGLNLKRRVRRTLPKRVPWPLKLVSKPNHQWALDFMHDSLYCGKRFRTLNVLDEGTRECLAIEVDSSLPEERVVRPLEQLREERRLPVQI